MAFNWEQALQAGKGSLEGILKAKLYQQEMKKLIEKDIKDKARFGFEQFKFGEMMKQREKEFGLGEKQHQWDIGAPQRKEKEQRRAHEYRLKEIEKREEVKPEPEPEPEDKLSESEQRAQIVQGFIDGTYTKEKNPDLWNYIMREKTPDPLEEFLLNKIQGKMGATLETTGNIPKQPQGMLSNEQVDMLIQSIDEELKKRK